ncbi:MAG: deoxyribonuclease HsdR, partial [Prevotellaceae bacterium]|nr:deoxyribonuclease HsdR [Candidatus Faecinaster equi]
QGTTEELKEVDTWSLGISLKPLTSEMKKSLALNYGLLVNAIREGKMKEAGITKGIILLEVNNKKMETETDFEEVVKAANQSSEGVLWIKAKTQSGLYKSFTVILNDEKKK